MVRLFTYGGIAVAIYIANHGSLFKYSHGLLDELMFFAFVAIVIAFHWPRKPSIPGSKPGTSTSAHNSQGAGQGFAFRCGKAFKKIRRYWSL